MRKDAVDRRRGRRSAGMVMMAYEFIKAMAYAFLPAPPYLARQGFFLAFLAGVAGAAALEPSRATTIISYGNFFCTAPLALPGVSSPEIAFKLTRGMPSTVISSPLFKLFACFHGSHPGPKIIPTLFAMASESSPP